MTSEFETIDLAGGMVSAAIAPALIGAFIALLAGGPFIAILVFGFAFMIAAGHVVFLALPLHALLTLLGWRPGEGTALAASVAIGAMPAAIFIGPAAAPYGGLFGLAGGGAFCLMSRIRCDGEEDGR